MGDKILLVKPPFFTPWTPPLGIAILKSFLGQHGYSVNCLDLNTDSELWGTHHTYFAALQQREDVSINDGYSKLWWILNDHMLAYINGANSAACSRVLDTIIPLYGIKCDSDVIKALIPIVDRYFKRLDEIIDRLDLADFRVVGTSTYTTSLASSLYLLKRVKQKYPHLKTVMGGGVFADDLAQGSQNLETLLQEYPSIDHVVIGEGELLFIKLLQGELGDKRAVSVADIEDVTLNLAESCLPDFSDLDLSLYYHLTIEGGRSCLFQCKFCSETVQWGQYRKKPMDLFARQIMHLAQQYGNNTFFLADSLINPYVTALANELIERKANVLYDGYLRADKPVTDRNRVRLWARSGLYRVRLGIESGSTHVLDLVGKKTNTQVYSEVLRSLAGAGVRTTTYWVVGFPGETEEDFQDTLRFVREHHPFIYELEAHPYYYYPQGQVGSSQQVSYSLYPDEVTQITKFRRWRVKDSRPTSEETFDRLRRLAQFAAGLGLPNIYTMGERYQAEDRWHLLYPLVAEVYKGTRVHRNEAQIPRQAATVLSQEWERQTPAASGAASIVCYRASIKQKLDSDLLVAAIDQLIRYNDILQLRLQSDMASASEDHEHSADRTLREYSYGQNQVDAEAMRRQIVEDLSAEMRPERGDSVRVALIADLGQPSCDLLLLVHRAIADGKSVALLLEDLFRIYEQLSEGRPAALRPVQKTFTEFVNESGGNGALAAGLSLSGMPSSHAMPAQGVTESCRVSLGENLSRELLSPSMAGPGPRADRALVSGILNSLAKSNAGEAIRVDRTIDYRAANSNLEHTAGCLTRIVRLPADCADDNLFGVHETPKGSTGDPDGAAQRELQAPDAAQEIRALLNMEYFVDRPWLGGDRWTPQGFVMDQNKLGGDYRLEVTPALAQDGIEICLTYRDEPGVKELAGRVAGCLVQNVEAALDQLDRYDAAKKFWLAEFDKNVQKSVIAAIAGEKHAASDGAWVRLPCHIQEPVLASLRKNYQSNLADVILAAYSVLLSRLSGVQDMVIVSAIGETEALPLRLHPSWGLGFGDFVQNVRQKVSTAMEHQPFTFHFLAGSTWSKPNVPPPVFDIGYAFGDAGHGRGGNGSGTALTLHPAIDETLGLVLEATGNGEGVGMQFAYRPSLLGQQAADALGAYLASVLEAVSRKPDIPLGYIVLSKKNKPGAGRSLSVR